MDLAPAQQFAYPYPYDYRDFDEQPASDGRDNRRNGDGLLAAALKGAAAGIVGTAVISLGMQYGPQLMQKYGLLQPTPQQQQSDQQQEEPTEKLAEKVAEGALHTELSPETKHTAGQAIHWGYGAAWGALYGVAHHELHLPAAADGALFGAVVGGVASTIVPSMGVSPSPAEQPMPINVMMLALHLLYGETTALAYRALGGD